MKVSKKTSVGWSRNDVGGPDVRSVLYLTDNSRCCYPWETAAPSTPPPRSVVEVRGLLESPTFKEEEHYPFSPSLAVWQLIGVTHRLKWISTACLGEIVKVSPPLT